MPASNYDRLDIPEFLKIPQVERKAIWENYRVSAKSVDEQRRRDRNRVYNEAARKEDASD